MLINKSHVLDKHNFPFRRTFEDQGHLGSYDFCQWLITVFEIYKNYVCEVARKILGLFRLKLNWPYFVVLPECVGDTCDANIRR